MKILFTLLFALLLSSNAQAFNMLIAAAGQEVAAPAGGPDTWYYAFGNGETDFDGNQVTGSQAYFNGSEVTVASGGTATTLSVRADSDSTSKAFVIGLWDSSNNLITSCTGSTPAVAGLQWLECAIDTAVTDTTTYKVAFQCEDYVTEIAYDNTENGFYDANTYDGSAVDPLVPSTDTNYGYGVRIYVD
jgi:hypothetical protein